jgi:kynureninase
MVNKVYSYLQIFHRKLRRIGDSAVTGHFRHPHARPWKHVDEPLTPSLARLVGAKESEVAHSSTLTSNLHNLFTSFYRPDKTRWKIVIEKGSFPSDWVSHFADAGERTSECALEKRG